MQKKTESKTFEERMFYGAEGITLRTPVVIRNLAREADQRIAQLTTDLAQARADLALCAQSAPLELVELVEELIDWIVGANSAPADPQLVIRAQATIERWKV